MKTKPSFTTRKVSVAVASALSAAAMFTAAPAMSADEQQADAGYAGNDVEVIAVTARLKSAASEVMEERREQAYVADLMGADQISRTGDSDAAAALRRVTGLTLKDGKFIYVRGLGERYSSTSLNGAIVPSPDPTRNVVPLDMFPASIIESLSVQKAGSPGAPAAFGGGHVDIRTKAIPSDFFFKVGVGTRYNSNDSDDALTYSGTGDDTWKGKDDGARGYPQSAQNTYDTYGGIDPINDIFPVVGDIEQAYQINREAAVDINRAMTVKAEDTDFAYRANVAVGNSWDLGKDTIFGLVAAGYYKRQQENYEELDIELADPEGTIENSKEIVGTDSIVQWSALLNMGLELDENNKIETYSTYLRDTSDDVSVAIEETIDTISEPNALQVYSIEYEERTLISNQAKGIHFFPSLYDLEVNWFYSDARAERYAPNEVSYTYGVVFDEETGEMTSRKLNTQDAPKYVYTRLDDDTENTGFDVTLPTSIAGAEVRFTAGYSYFERARENYASRFTFDATGFDSELLTEDFHVIFADENILDAENDFELGDSSTDTEDYVAAEMIDAGFASFDVNIDDVWRFTGGIRYEDFRRTTLPIDEDGEISTEDGRYEITDYVVVEDGWFPSLAATWQQSDQMQWRFGVSKTIVRPDLREVSPVRFQDPVTGIDSFGNPELESSDIINADVRWEWYMESGSNLSIGAFYKDLEAPIEPVQRITEAGQQQKYYNADSGYIYGIETEFLRDFSFIDSESDILDGMFIAGNLTLSDSEIEISPNSEIDPTNTKRRMTGHSEYVANLQFSFDSPDQYHSATLVYNVFGKRIAWGGSAGLGDIYEQPFHSLDFTYTLFPTDSIDVKFKAKNILGEESEYKQNGHKVFWKEPGTELTLQFSYEY
ncbi:TonB-dependent receptor [Neiella marina]|uniref:TonB-dependent receptor n=1 Tax=Neiella holothuriorum TaxID=2870530 RepID=A0ABS7EII9_9GAMM|nr:TonB-dependent receptor [Neiella holothuriorum]MBW8192168.1 TonB-dependent receptor [Neiella holothuriorum]